LTVRNKSGGINGGIFDFYKIINPLFTRLNSLQCERLCPAKAEKALAKSTHKIIFIGTPKGI